MLKGVIQEIKEHKVTTLLPLLSAHAATSGKQSNFTRKSSSHNKPSEGKAANPKMASNLPSTADSSHQAVPANKQVSCPKEATLPNLQGSRRPWCLAWARNHPFAVGENSHC